jgi:hypothetical protein
LVGFRPSDFDASGGQLLHQNGELRLPVRKIRRRANVLLTDCARFAHRLQDPLKICVAIMERRFVNRSKTASPRGDIVGGRLPLIAIARKFRREFRYFAV